MSPEYHIPDFALKRPRTRIVCTIGPATDTMERVVQLIHAGMSVARFNLSHGDRATHERYIRTVREAARQTGVSIGVLADLPGPKYRLGELSAPGLYLSEGSRFTLTTQAMAATQDRATIRPAGLQADVPAGATVLIDEGAIELRVDSVNGTEIKCTVTVGGELKARKAVTAPGHTSTLDYFTDETVAALDFASDANVDFVGLSYIRDADDLRRVREYMQRRGCNPQLVSKIELGQAVQNLESILEVSDGVMVARGDLGVEMPLSEVPGSQKRIIRLANEAGKPVITATQMLESMIESPHPTRAEASDVYNAIFDGTDAIMLSGETSIGKYPLRAVEYMAEIARHAEEAMDFDVLAERRRNALVRRGQQVDDAIAYSACRIASALKAKVILAFTESGSTAARVASFRPSSPILALMPQEATAEAKLSLRWGVLPLKVPKFRRVQEMFFEGSRAAVETGYAKDGDLAVAVVGMPIGVPGNTNLVRVIRIPEPPPTP